MKASAMATSHAWHALYNAGMPMTDRNRAFLQIHFCVLLWGFTAIFGKLISLPALPLVWWRMLIVVAVLALVPRVWRGLRAMPLRLMLSYAGSGVLVALHWLTFYGSIKLSNASVGATCIALATVFTALVDPWLARTRCSRRELALGIAVLAGVALVVGGGGGVFQLAQQAPGRACGSTHRHRARTRRRRAGTDPAGTTDVGAALVRDFPGVRRRPAGPAGCTRCHVPAGAGAGVHDAAVRAVASRAAAHERIRRAAGGEPGTGLRHHPGDRAAGRTTRTDPR